jgi:hypothetical protein
MQVSSGRGCYTVRQFKVQSSVRHRQPGSFQRHFWADGHQSVRGAWHHFAASGRACLGVVFSLFVRRFSGHHHLHRHHGRRPRRGFAFVVGSGGTFLHPAQQQLVPVLTAFLIPSPPTARTPHLPSLERQSLQSPGCPETPRLRPPLWRPRLRPLSARLQRHFSWLTWRSRTRRGLQQSHITSTAGRPLCVITQSVLSSTIISLACGLASSASGPSRRRHLSNLTSAFEHREVIANINIELAAGRYLDPFPSFPAVPPEFRPSAIPLVPFKRNTSCRQSFGHTTFFFPEGASVNDGIDPISFASNTRAFFSSGSPHPPALHVTSGMAEIADAFHPIPSEDRTGQCKAYFTLAGFSSTCILPSAYGLHPTSSRRSWISSLGSASNQ